MTTATYGRDALESSREWAKPHSRSGRRWLPFQPRENYYHVAPAAGVNASIKDMSHYLIAHMGGRTDVLPAELLDTLHRPVVATPTEMTSAPWRRGRLRDAHYALGWRVFDYAGETLVFHAGAVQGYRGVIAFLPQHRFGLVMLWNCETALPTGLLPMAMDATSGCRRSIGLASKCSSAAAWRPAAPRADAIAGLVRLSHTPSTAATDRLALMRAAPSCRLRLRRH